MRLEMTDGKIIMDRDALGVIDHDALEKWLAERACPDCGGLAHDHDDHVCPATVAVAASSAAMAASASQFALGMIAATHGPEAARDCNDAIACLGGCEDGTVFIVKRDAHRWNPAWERCFRDAWSFHVKAPGQVRFTEEETGGKAA